jgi:hypothetical protein
MIAAIIPWATVVAELIRLGVTTYEQVSALFKGQHDQTDVQTAAEDNAQLLLLRGLIADNREKARIEAGLPPDPTP